MFNQSRHGSALWGVWGAVMMFGASPCFAEALPARYEVLLIGNSHSAANHLPAMLEAMLKLQHPEATVLVVRAPDLAFLDEHLDNSRTRKIFGDRQWTHVILQAQKYSTTGRYRYSTAAAERWLRKIREHGAKGVMFPEWARVGHDEEAARIHALHEGIAAKVPACVAPVGLVWQQVQNEFPDLRLHDEDGNHANAVGSWLTAMTLTATINGELSALPVFNDTPLLPEQQSKMQALLRERLRTRPLAGCGEK